MMTQLTGNARGGVTTGALLASAVGLLALPSAVLAFTVSFDPGKASAARGEAIDVLPREAGSASFSRNFPASSLAMGNLYPFTPASTPARPDRSVTVAVRVDQDTARALTVRAPRVGQAQPTEKLDVRIAPTGFSLGVSRGYANFAQAAVRKDDQNSPAIPDTGRFSLVQGGTGGETRFNPRIVLEETQAAGRAPQTFAGDADDRVDLGGSYRLTRNLDVTAGVRYSQERERLIPPDNGKQDSQAVYVGTQFRF